MNKSKFLSWWPAIYCVVLALIVQLPTSPFFRSIYYRDHGVFAYIGQQILQGALPYKDVWDHKTPLVYYIEAFSQLVGGEVWGNFFVRVIIFILGLTVFYLALRRLSFTKLKSLVGVTGAAFITSLFLDGGGLTAEYYFALQAAGLWLFAKLLTKPTYLSAWFWLGFVTGLSILLKPNHFALLVVLGSILLLKTVTARKWRQVSQYFLVAALGGLIPLAVTAIYFGLRGGLSELVDQTLRYNFAYSGTSWQARLDALVSLIAKVPLGEVIAVLIFFVSAYLIYKAFINYKRSQKLTTNEILILVALIALAAELLLALWSGRVYSHYFLVLAIPAALWLVVTLQHLAFTKQLSLLIGIVAFILVLGRSYQVIQTQPLLAVNQALSEFIQNTSAVSDSIFIWGAESSIYYHALRQAASNYPYQFAFFTPHYLDQLAITDLIAELKVQKPKLIIDAAVGAVEMVSFTKAHLEPIDPNYQTPSELKQLGIFIQQNYTPIWYLENNWIVYSL